MVFLIEMLRLQEATPKDFEELWELLLENHSMNYELFAAVEVLHAHIVQRQLP